MGGYHSGRHVSFRAKTIVEDCLILSTGALVPSGSLRRESHAVCTVTWGSTYAGGEPPGIGLEINTGRDGGWVRLSYTLAKSGEAVDYRVSLTTTPLPWGGLRWWFICPLVVEGRSCGRRVGKLYAPPGARHFGCRHCHNLTYRTCQESHRFDRCFAELGAPMGLSAKEVAHLLSGDWRKELPAGWRRHGKKRRAAVPGAMPA